MRPPNSLWRSLTARRRVVITIKSFGLTVPANLLLTADEVIE